MTLLLFLAPLPWAAEDVPQAVKALRHLQPKPNAGPTAWTAGEYQYDGAGNIAAIGSEAFVYDKLGRLRSATVRGPDMTSLQTQTFHYDEYGNLTETSRLGQSVSLPVDASTNRLTAVPYDASGNIIASGIAHYDYDAAGMLNALRLDPGLQPRVIYAYTADDERLFSFDVAAGTTHWTLRGLDNKVLRDFKQAGSTWSVDRDYIYRDGLLLAALKPNNAVEHYTLDHLGTPRLITDGSGHKVGYHVHWPFGEEWSPGTAQEASPLKFTGHERDADPTGGSAPLDYMHARYYRAEWGRFLAFDDAASQRPAIPQRWNRYAYAAGNPLAGADPDGREVYVYIQNAGARQALLAALRQRTGLDLYYDGNRLLSRGALQGARGSAIARNDLLKALEPSRTFGVYDTRSAWLGKFSGTARAGTVLLNTTEISQINPGRNSSDSFDIGTIFMHELLAHGINGKDDFPGTVKNAHDFFQKFPMWRGDAVDYDNRIAAELGLDSRSQYRTEKDRLSRTYIPFSNGPVHVPPEH
ncbi:MAG TPA: RHS repeat-associated core domain-containing protein [Thermoanaerobaculia bacterium]|nr:RHS repeat-associated core domain-containing protein [Thermoanaerobaculia bacterium]